MDQTTVFYLSIPAHLTYRRHTMTQYHDRLEAGEFTVQPEPAEPTVDELKDQLRELDLPVSGTKAELIARLEEANETE